mgnify:CR=1 FL=1
MPIVRQVGFVGPSYTLRSVSFDAQRCVNLYPELDELGTGKNREVAALVQRPGLLKLATLGIGPIRGLYRASTGNTFAVSGTGLYEITVPTAPVLLATGTTGSGPVSIADNGIHLVMVDGAKGYALNLSTGVLVEITDADFPAGANVVQFQDQYIIVNEPGSSRFWISALADATNWDGLDFASAEGSPDRLVTLLVNNRELILFGAQSTEIFFNSGNPDFPFERIQGAFIEQGIAAAATAKEIDNSPFWLGQDENGNGMVWRLVGYQGKRVSTHAVEQAIAGYGDLSAATAYVYQWKGHSFYALNFPSANTTWVFDIATNLWSEQTYTKPTGGEIRHRAENHCCDGTRHLVGDFENGNLYQLSDETYTDDGAPITRRRRAPHRANDGKWIFNYSFQLDLEMGVGLVSGNGSDPKLMYRFSDDGGRTWSNEKWVSAGKIGEYKKRAIWRRLGQTRDRVDEVVCTDPVRMTWISALHGVEGGAH